MRNMAFSLTTQQMRVGTKDVTRRTGWDFLNPDDVVMAVEKGMGLKKGEKIVRIGPIKIISVRLESVDSITKREVEREGFVGMTPDWFVDFFCKTHKCKPSTIVNRIEFKHLYRPGLKIELEQK